MNPSEFERAYPNYCRKCKAWGMFKSLSPKIHFSDCECIKARRCPRCGERALSDLDTCDNCGWYRDDANRGLPGSNVV